MDGNYKIDLTKERLFLVRLSTAHHANIATIAICLTAVFRVLSREKHIENMVISLFTRLLISNTWLLQQVWNKMLMLIILLKANLDYIIGSSKFTAPRRRFRCVATEASWGRGPPPVQYTLTTVMFTKRPFVRDTPVSPYRAVLESFPTRAGRKYGSHVRWTAGKWLETSPEGLSYRVLNRLTF